MSSRRNSGARQWSLRARLIAWAMAMLALTIVVAGVDLLGQYQIERLDHRRKVDDAIARLSLRAGTAMLKARRYEKDFLLYRNEFGFQEAKARYVTLARSQASEVQRRMGEIRQVSTDPATLHEAQTVEQAVREYETSFLKVVDLYQALGFVDTGLEGEFRAKAHAIEAAIEARGGDSLMVRLLAMRRHEKDFVARSRDVYVDRLDAAVQAFKAEAGRSSFPGDSNAVLQSLADGYLGAFHRYVATVKEIDEANAGYLKLLQVVEPSLDRLTSRVAELELLGNARRDRLNRTAIAATVGVTLLAIGVSGVLAFFVSRSVGRSMRQTMGFAERLAGGDLDARMGAANSAEFVTLGAALNRMADSLREARAGLERRVAERTAELAQLSAEAKEKADALLARNREINLLGELGDLLQRCANVEEACEIIPKYGARLFEGDSGGVYLTSASRNVLERVAAWGQLHAEGIFAPEECWALRRGQPHVSDGPEGGLRCGHAPQSARATLCIPMLSHGEAAGIVAMLAAAGSEWTDDRQRLAASLAELVGLALTNIRLREALRSLSIRDPLTGLFNRRYLEETLDREVARARRNATPLAVLMLDVDHFKRFNDTYGHEAGDVVLRDFGMLLRETVRVSDIPCRYGGEEFLLILPDSTLEGALQRAEILRRSVAEMQPKLGAQPLGGITLSIGVAAFPHHADTSKSLVGAADAALYQAKAAGRDRVLAASAIPVERIAALPA